MLQPKSELESLGGEANLLCKGVIVASGLYLQSFDRLEQPALN